MTSSGGSSTLLIVWVVALFAMMYFLTIRPQQQQKKKREAMMASLRKDNRIITIGGLRAVIVDVKDDDLIINVAEDSSQEILCRIKKWAINAVEGKPEFAEKPAEKKS